MKRTKASSRSTAKRAKPEDVDGETSLVQISQRNHISKTLEIRGAACGIYDIEDWNNVPDLITRQFTARKNLGRLDVYYNFHVKVTGLRIPAAVAEAMAPLSALTRLEVRGQAAAWSCRAGFAFHIQLLVRVPALRTHLLIVQADKWGRLEAGLTGPCDHSFTDATITSIPVNYAPWELPQLIRQL